MIGWIMKKRTLLGVFAHPDDESFGPGGTLARCAAEGIELHVCTLTDGAAGTADADCWDCLQGDADLVDRRLHELQCAVKVLGGTLHYMGYRDSGMEGNESNLHPDAFVNQPLEIVAARLTRLIRELRPDVILTHDETGGYFHPDHIHTHRATLMAFQAAGDPTRYPAPLAEGVGPFSPPRFYCTVIPRSRIRIYVWLARLTGQDPTRYGRNKDVDLTRLGKPANQIHFRVNVQPYLEVKRQASACHRSQGGGGGLDDRTRRSLGERLSRWLRQRAGHWDMFQQLYPPPTGRRLRNDLFEGIPQE
jgi:LmbE family N-acetylglucosaminyl deacetylase